MDTVRLPKGPGLDPDRVTDLSTRRLAARGRPATQRVRLEASRKQGAEAAPSPLRRRDLSGPPQEEQERISAERADAEGVI